MSTSTDDLEAVRLIAETLQPFSAEDRERILRWAREKVGMTAVPGGVPTTLPAETAATTASTTPATIPPSDIKTFVNQKAPKSDMHFVGTVAYYHQFVAPNDQRKDSITKDDLVEACRQVPRKRPKRPDQVLVNAYHGGVLDRAGKGRYKLNSVGENLVAMVLPGTSEPTAERKKATRAREQSKPKSKGGRKTRG